MNFLFSTLLTKLQQQKHCVVKCQKRVQKINNLFFCTQHLKLSVYNIPLSVSCFFFVLVIIENKFLIVFNTICYRLFNSISNMFAILKEKHQGIQIWLSQ